VLLRGKRSLVRLDHAAVGFVDSTAQNAACIAALDQGAAGLRPLLDVRRARDPAKIIERVAEHPAVANDVAFGVPEHGSRRIRQRAGFAVPSDEVGPLRLEGGRG
jgi:hypothetical protein